jgi:uncharacterized protein (TIGR03435 family)
MRRALLVLACVTCRSALADQTLSSSSQTFEVASVKLMGSDAALNVITASDKRLAEITRFQGGPGTDTPTRITYNGVTLKMLLGRAFNLPDEDIFGPAWIDKQQYEVVAKLPPNTNMSSLRAMLRQLLEERFSLKCHTESRVAPVYPLTVGRNGSKLRPAKKEPDSNDGSDAAEVSRARTMAMLQESKARILAGDRRNHRLIESQDSTVAKLATALAPYLDHPVEDQTHLEGGYSFRLDWISDNRPPVSLPPAENDGPLGASLFEAIEEQLGLRLQLQRRQTEVLVVETAERTPTSN